tara:strand:+ start:16402 stop:18129 length:1728 start_codon:yes stop_codon:yes gene_type:complete
LLKKTEKFCLIGRIIKFNFLKKKLYIRHADKLESGSIFFNRLCYLGGDDLDNLHFIESNITSREIESSLKYLNNSFNKYLPQLLKNFGLNDKYPLEFWKPILYNYVFSCLALIHKYELIFEEINSYNINFFTEAIRLDNIEIKVKNHLNYYLNSEIQFQILSFILHHKKYSNINVKTINYKKEKENKVETKKKIKFKSQILFWIYQFKIFRIITPYYGISLIDSILIYFKLNNKNTIKAKFKQSKIKISDEKIIDWRLDLISQMLPKNMGKNIKLFMDKFEKIKYKKGRVNLIQNSLWFDIKKLVYYNLAKFKGEIIVPSQHGGHAFYNDIEFRKEFESNHNYFMIWGKKIVNPLPKNYIIVPSPLFSKISTYKKRSKGKIFYVGTSLPKFNPLYWGWFLNSNDTFKFRESMSLLIDFFETNEPENFYFRPYIGNSKQTHLDDTDFFKKKHKKLKIIQGKLHYKLTECKLLILDSPGTTLSIGIAMNIPTLLFFDSPDFFSINKNKSVFKLMYHLGILHFNLETFIEKYFKIKADPYSWWQIKEIQKFRESFLKDYALADKNWKKITINKINNLQ